MFKRKLDYRIVAEPWSPNPGSTCYLLEVKNSIFGIKYWSTIYCSFSLKEIQDEYKKRKKT